MKKQIVIFGMMAVLMIVSITGCFEDSSNNQDQAKFVGSWTSDDEENYPYIFGKQVTFYSNGTMIYGIMEDEASYELSNGKITTIYPDGRRGASRDYSFSNDNTELTVTDPTWDKTAVYTKVLE